MNTGTTWPMVQTGAHEVVSAGASSWLTGLLRRGKPPRDNQAQKRRAFARLMVVVVSTALLGSGLMRLTAERKDMSDATGAR